LGGASEELVKRLARVEGRVEELSKRIDDLRNDMNHRFEELSKRIDDLRNDVNHRLEELSKRVDRVEERLDRNFRWTIGVLITMWVTTILTILLH